MPRRVKREEQAYKPTPVITDFTDADGNDRMKEMIQENYNRISCRGPADCRRRVASASSPTPELQYLFAEQVTRRSERKTPALTVTDFLLSIIFSAFYITDGAFPFHYIQWCGCRRVSFRMASATRREGELTDAATDFPVIPLLKSMLQASFGGFRLHNHDANTLVQHVAEFHLVLFPVNHAFH